jgi:hypothetical protein
MDAKTRDTFYATRDGLAYQYEFEIEAGGQKPFFHVIAWNDRGWKGARTEFLPRADNRDWDAFVRRRIEMCLEQGVGFKPVSE